MSNSTIYLGALLYLISSNSFSATDIVTPAKLWYPAILTFEGPTVDEKESTYRNYRLDVTFSKGAKSFKVPGYFAADGNAHETSASSGNKWRVKFTPDESGQWNYSVSFRAGTDIAISMDPAAGTAIANVDGEKGTFEVGAYDGSAPGFFGKGMLRYVGEHYAQFAGNGEWFVKAGPGSPEDFFGYKDFDGTVDHPIRTKDTQKSDAVLQKLNGESLHFYTTHVNDWKTGDPTWKGGKGKGIIGALNYQASIGCNSQYIILLTYNDDGDNTWPWVSREAFASYDVSKLDQWDIVLSHMDRLGIIPNLYFTESNNSTKLDDGNLTLNLPIYYREILARFNYHLGIRYNLGEESKMSPEQKIAAADYIAKLNVYKHPIGAGCGYKEQSAQYTPLLGKKAIDGAWMLLTSGDKNDHTEMYNWRDKSAQAGHKWIVAIEEPNGIKRTDLNVAELSSWRAFMGGGEGFSQYTAYGDPEIGDITLENFRLIEPTLKLIVGPKNLLSIPVVNRHLNQMRSEDGLVENVGGNEPPFCFAKKGEVYVLYRSSTANQKTLDLTGHSGSFYVKWFDPRVGGTLQAGSTATVTGGSKVSLGAPPKDADKSWGIVVSKVDPTRLSQKKINRNAGDWRIHSFDTKGLRISFPDQGPYLISLYDLDGKLIGKASGFALPGINLVTLNKPIEKGKLFLTRLEFKDATLEKKIVGWAY